ncbi:S41 family peptidase [Xanthomarina spongicola]|uniref:Peptidase S41-like protein n=1 Tax=Xanthomarina spongicola TaxID=570520 RepID=A0A316DID2_9FLAO|nr:S41 family peptidase [Xanthomarina spongicola]PWK17914.1 peptidase S41-like protein [Xanthomarina spongicola]
MKSIKLLFILFILSFVTIGCFEDLDDNPVSTRDLNDFVWKGLNTYYLYKDNVPDLANDRFNDSEYESFLNSFSSPEDLFESLIYQRPTIDRFSWITDNYIELQQQLNGTTYNNGMEFGLVRFSSTSSEVFGYVRYVLPNTDAENKGLQRGLIFHAVNGTSLNLDNYRTLLSPNNYTINLATYNDNGTPETDDDSIEPTNQSINLTKTPYTENPIFIKQILEVDNQNVGYLMYNGFTRDFDSQLNETFNYFQSQNIQNLVLDLRYNSGGSVNTAILLSSMITGQFTGQTFATQQWNSEIQSQIDPNDLIYNFTDNDDGISLNSLQLAKVYVLTTKSTASASELVINCLNPYIDVVQIGGTTTGKYQASITLYDSPDFSNSDINPIHTYAMQPLVLKTLNTVGYTDYNNGLDPDIIASENYGNLGVLGNPDETLLAIALQHIIDTGRISLQPYSNMEVVGDSKDFTLTKNQMYVD